LKGYLKHDFRVWITGVKVLEQELVDGCEDTVQYPFTGFKREEGISILIITREASRSRVGKWGRRRRMFWLVC
jgi:hypothetical protein